MHLRQSSERFPRITPQALACLLLVLFLLYNPFLAAASSPFGLNIHHRASNRATIGASELQPLSYAHARAGFAAASTLVWLILAAIPFLSHQRSLALDSNVSAFPLSRICGANHRFRPPPASKSRA